MSQFILSCCSTADLTKAQLQERNISYLCFHYYVEGNEYLDDLGESMSYDDFYAAMSAGAMTRTSQVNVEEYTDYFRRLLQEGDVLHVTLSSGLSGTCQSANIAAETVRREFPHRRIRIVDSLGASTGFGLLMLHLADLRDAGKSLDEVADWTKENRLYMQHLFFSTDLTFYVRGGRISRTAGFVGGLLGICPLLDMDGEGHLCPREKVRSKKKVMARIVDKMAEIARDGENYTGKCYMCQSACPEDAEAVAAMIRARFPKLDGEIVINSIGTTIGSHTGPGTIACFFWGREKRS